MDGLSKTFGTLTMSLLVVLAISFSALPALGQYGGGSGTAEDPYLIYTPEEMYTIGAMLLDYDKHFRLMANIDLSGYTGTSFFIIGSSSFPFTGVFDGNGHTISKFTYTSNNTDYIGLFGYVDGPGAEIKNLGLINPNVDTGKISRYVGALVGYNVGTITNCYGAGGNVSAGDDVGGLVGESLGKIANCYATGIVSGDRVVGGLVGTNEGTIFDCYSAGSVEGRLFIGGLVGLGGVIRDCWSAGSVSATGGWGSVGGLVGGAGTISHCYSTASVSASDSPRVGGLVGMGGNIYNSYATGNVTGGDYAIGGLVGDKSGPVVNCYSTGSVSGSGTDVGGLVGSNRGMVSACFWDVETSGRSNMCGSVGGEGSGCNNTNGKTTAQMQDINTFLSAGWDFVNQAEGPSDDWAEPPGRGGYMILWWQLPEDQLPALPTFSGGTGEPGDPYLIATSSDLNRIGHNPRLMAASPHFKLVNDIDLAGVEFFFIGNPGYDYSGIFDGNGHTISNFTYNWPPASYVGLFGGIAGEDAGVKDLGLIGPNVDAGRGDYVGSLVGLFADGTITGCYVEGGSVSGEWEVGGLVGKNLSGAIADCHAVGSVSGMIYVGGLVGTSGGTMTNCRSSGIVLGDGSVGGLVGSGGVISDCHSSGDVSGSVTVGGLVGYGDTVTNCYATGDVSGGISVGGLVGQGRSIVNSYSTGSVSGTDWRVGGLVGSGGNITNCYSTGSVSGDLIVGGLVGENKYEGTVTNCYSTGRVTGTTKVGGLMGWNEYGTISASFWDIQTSGRSNMCGSEESGASGCDDGNGKTTVQMQTESTFSSAGWDFLGETDNGTEDIWRLCNDGAEYPQLRWQYLLGDFVCPDGVDWSDLSVLCEQWLEVGAYSADIGPGPDSDGIVNFPDFAALADNWLTGL